VAHGEQYLGASPELYSDQELLDEVRPWFTLDSDPADRRRLGDELEAWSCLEVRDQLVVARLTTAGTYDRRSAYFSHGRFFPWEGTPPGVDPGVLLGRAGAFDDPGEQIRTPERSLAVPVFDRPDALEERRQLGTELLAQLFEAVVGGIPVVLAVEAEELRRGSSLLPVVSFARAALPADVRRRCRVRIYTREPQLFLLRERVTLVVVPREVAPAATLAGRVVRLLDGAGRRLSGPEVRAEVQGYARQVVDRTLEIPRTLSRFTARYARTWPEGSFPARSDGVFLTYSLDYALSEEATVEVRRRAVEEVLPRMAGTLDLKTSEWEGLLSPEDWSRLPAGAVEKLGETLDGGSEGPRALLEAAGRALPQVIARAESWVRDPRSLARAVRDPWRCRELVARTVDGRLDPAWILRLARETESRREVLRVASELWPQRPGSAAGKAIRGILLDALEGLQLPPGELLSVVGSWRGEAVRDGEVAVFLRLEALLSNPVSGTAPPLPRTAALSIDELLARAGDLAEESEEVRGLLWVELDRCFLCDPARTIRALIHTGWWTFWRRGTALGPQDRRGAALEWLAAEVWRERRCPEAGLEDWSRAVEDLHLPLSAHEARRLAPEGTPTWPWIPPFEGRQVRDLLGRCAEEAQGEIYGAVRRAMAELPEEARAAIEQALEELRSISTGRGMVGARPRSVVGGGMDRILERVAAELSAGTSDGPGVEQLVEAVCRYRRGSYPGEHPVRVLAEYLEGRAEVSGEGGFEALSRATRAHPVLLEVGPEEAGGLPALDLAAALLPGESMGYVALRVAFPIGHASRSRDERWWRGLLDELERPRPCGGLAARDHRVALARALLAQAVPRLDPAAGAALARALGFDRAPDHQRLGESRTMSEHASFFFPNREERGRYETRRWYRRGLYEVFAVMPKGKGRRLLSRDPASLEELDAWREEVTRVLEKEGGLESCQMVVLKASGGGRWDAEVRSVEFQGSSQPRRALMVLAGATTRWIDLASEVIQLPPGSHLVVPVDRDAQTCLERLSTFLGGLPPELESYVYYGLANPSLEERVARLEYVSQGSDPPRQRSRPQGIRMLPARTRGWLKRPVSAGLFLLLVAAAVIVGSVAAWRESRAPQIHPAPPPQPVESPSPGTPDEVATEPEKTATEDAGAISGAATGSQQSQEGSDSQGDHTNNGESAEAQEKTTGGDKSTPPASNRNR
jgi:hypothetical protein